MIRIHSLAVVVVTLLPATSVAEGLLYQLPVDGCWVRFQFDGTYSEPGNTDVTALGTLTMSSVGTTQIDGVRCRWIEIVIDWKRAGQPLRDVYKLLIPEEDLSKGKEPLKHVLKAWHRALGDTDPRQIDCTGPGMNILEPLRAVLPGPFQTTEELQAVGVDTKLGTLSCRGIMARERTDRPGALSVETSYLIRLHDTVPFGVAALEASVTTEREGQRVGKGTHKMRLADFGKDAKSEMPEVK